MQGGVFLDPDRGAVWRAGLNHVLSRVHPSSMGPNFSFHISAVLESQELLAPMYEPRMPIALAATIDYMLAEIIELTGNVVRNRKSQRSSHQTSPGPSTTTRSFTNSSAPP